MTQPFIIAIDGPSASGKGTLARGVAERFGYAYLDTGLLYRAVGFAVLSAGGDPDDGELAEQAALALAVDLSGNRLPGGALTAEDRAEALLAALDFRKLMDNEVLRGDEASAAASKVAVLPAVRNALLQFQRDFCAAPPDGKGGAVLDGRDIGTVIAPDAPVKLFVTASAEARAGRRFKELQRRGVQADYDGVLADLNARDARDAERDIAPARPAADAVLLDTTDMTADRALDEAVRIVEARQAGG